LKEYLFRNNLTVKEFAFRLGISASYLYQLIKRERRPSLKLAQRIEEYTGGEVDLNQLINGDFSSKKTNTQNLEKEDRLRKIEERVLKLEEKIYNADY
jgi:transcriptional regulator with XRE-family HTH domain